jgi:hypothetical protein
MIATGSCTRLTQMIRKMAMTRSLGCSVMCSVSSAANSLRRRAATTRRAEVLYRGRRYDPVRLGGRGVFRVLLVGQVARTVASSGGMSGGGLIGRRAVGAPDAFPDRDHAGMRDRIGRLRIA